VFAILSLTLPFAACQKSSSSPAASSPTTPVPSVKLAVTQQSYSFPATVVGQSVQGSTIDLSASGTGSLVLASITSSNPAEFVLSDVANCIGMTLVGGAPSSCHIAVRFQPMVPGVRAAKIVASSSDASNVTIDVFGTAVASQPSGAPPGDGGSGGSGSGGDGSGGGGSSGSTGGGSFPQAPCIPNGTNGIVFTVINTASQLIQLTLTGPTTITLSIAPWDIQAVAIAPGNYTINGETPSTPTVHFTPSSWSVVAGCDYLGNIVSITQNKLALTR